MKKYKITIYFKGGFTGVDFFNCRSLAQVLREYNIARKDIREYIKQPCIQ